MTTDILATVLLILTSLSAAEKYTEESRLRIQQTQTEIHEMKAHNDILENAPVGFYECGYRRLSSADQNGPPSDLQSGLAAAQAVYASLKHDHKQLTHYAENVKNKASKLAEAIKALDEEVAKKSKSTFPSLFPSRQDKPAPYPKSQREQRPSSRGSKASRRPYKSSSKRRDCLIKRSID